MGYVNDMKVGLEHDNDTIAKCNFAMHNDIGKKNA